MEELKAIIQRMMDNNESQDKIRETVRLYKEQNPEKFKVEGKTNGDVTGANATSKNGASETEENTDLELEDGSSGLPEPSWGDLFKSGLNTLIGPAKTAVISKVGETITDVYDDYKEGKEKEEEARRSKQEYVDQSFNFNQELDKAFGDNPTLFGQIIENPSDLSLQDRQVSNAGSPDKYLLELVKKQLGGFGLLGEDSEFRQSNYPDLNNDDLHELIEDKFYSKLEEYKQNKSNKLSLEKASRTENVRQWQDDNRATMISGYSDVDYGIAQQVEKLNHGELTEEEWEAENLKLLDLKAKKGDGTSMMYDLGTGQLTTARGSENNENVVPLNKEEKQAEWKSAIGLLKPENQLDYLRNEFERSALTLSAHNEELDKVQRWSVLKTGYELADDKAKGRPLERRRIVESTLREMMMDTEFANLNPVPTDELRSKSGEDRDNVINKWVADIKTYKQDNLDYNREYEALKGMYLLNEGLDDLQKPEYLSVAGLPTIIPTNFSALKQSGEKLIEPWTGDYYTTSMMGSTGRENITATDVVYDNLGIEKTLSEQKQTEESLSEMVNGGLLGMNKMLVEFAGINKGMAITGLASKVAGVHKLLTSGRWVKNGKVISDAAMKARAAAKGMTVEAYASQLGRFSNVKKLKAAKGGYEGFKFIPATNGSKALDVLFGGLVEGAKFEAFTQFDITKLEMKPEAGEHFGFAEGFGFGMAGRIVAPLSPFLQRKGFLKDIDKTVLGRKFGVNSRKLFETFVTQPASFVVGSNAGGIVDNLVKDALGNESFKNFIDEKYGDYDQLGKDLIVEYLTGLGLGGIHFKGFKDYRSKAGLLRGREKSLDLMRQVAGQGRGSSDMVMGTASYEKSRPDAVTVGSEGKTTRLREDLFSDPIKIESESEITIEDLNNLFDPKVQEKIHNNLSDKNLAEFYNHYEMYDMFSRRYLDAQRAEGYLDPARADELVKQDHKEFLRQEKEAGNEVTIEVVNNNKLRFGQKGIDPNRRAEILDNTDGKGKRIRYNAERYTPDVMAHEVHHYFTEELFGRDVVFKSEFMNELNNTASKIKLGRLITEAEAKELGNEGLAGKKMNLSQAIKLEKFDLTSARNNTKISQWELFAHVAEQIGNKNNYLDIKGSEGFVGLKNLLSTLSKRSGKKLNLSTQGDIVEWFSKYSENVKKGKSVVELFSELKDVVDVEATRINREQRKLFGETGPDTWSSRDFELPMDGGRVNDAKQIASDSKKFFENNNLKGKGVDAYRELMGQKTRRDGGYDIDFESPHSDFEYYPVLGNKLGPMFDIALAKYQRNIGDQFKVKNLGDRSYGGERAELATAVMSDPRGLESILKTYDPSKGEFMSHVVNGLKIRMEEIKARSIDQKYMDRGEAGKAGMFRADKDISDMSMDLMSPSGGGGIDKASGSTEIVEPEGLKIKDHEFTYEGGNRRKIDPRSTQRINEASEKVFFETPLNQLTYVEVAKKLREATIPEMDLLFRGGKEGLIKPKEIKLAEDVFINPDNAPVLYDAMHEFSNPKFYENTNWGKTIFSKFYKNTGVNFKNTELPVELTKTTNARTTKWEKLPATKKRVAEFVELLNSGRDAGTVNKKRATLKEGVGDPYALQTFREMLTNPEFIAKAESTPEGKAKLEGLKAELAMRKLRGATPEKLASEDLDIMDMFIKDVKGIDYAKEQFPGFSVRNIIENNSEYKELLERTGGVDRFLKDMGYELKGLDLKTWQSYAEANRILDNLTVKDVTPTIFDGGYKGQKGRKGVHEAIYEFARENNIPEELLNLNIDAAKRMADPEFSRRYVEKFLPEFYNTFDSRLIKELDMMLRKTMGEGDQRFGYRELVDWISSKTGEFKGKRRKIFDADMGKEIISKLDGIKDNIGFDPKYVRVNVNGTTKTNLNKLLDRGIPVTPEQKVEFAAKVKEMLSPDNTVKGYDKMVKANEGMMEYFASKVYDYLKNAKTVEQKAEAINNMSYMFQIQTNLGNGIFRGLASHTTVSIRKGAKHSEHDLQLANYTGNILMSALKNSGSKSAFTNKVKQLTKSYKQSLIEKEIQEKFDSREHGGKAGFDFEFTTKSGKYPWLREKLLAETTLDLATGKTYDQLLTDVIGGGKTLRTAEARKNKILKDVGLNSKDLSPTEKDILIKNVDKAMALGRKKNKKGQGMATFDFDETLIIDGENFVIAKKGKETVNISSSNWPIEGPKYAERGFDFDFSDFVNVRGGKEGPLLQKMKNLIGKHGPKDVFVLTARMQDAAVPIHQWLKSKGVDIPLENITGLGKSQGEAKAQWMLEKFAEGYNDMYFVDDALPNVEAVKKVLDQLDIKSKVQQALASKDLSNDVNDIMKHSLDIASEKTFSKAEAKVRGADIKRRRIFMTDSAADLELLLEPLYGKGKKGIENQKWFNENFMKPFERGYNDLNNAKQKAANEYMALRKQNKDVVKSLDKEVGDTGFTTDMAMRVYVWNKNGVKIPDLAKATERKLVEHIRSNPELQAFAENTARLTGQENGIKDPSSSWWAETLASEIGNLGEGVNRKKHLADWIEAKNEIFSEENLNKMESKLGSNWRKNAEEMFERMETGRTRKADLGTAGNALMDYLNGSVGTIMSLNTRSATLQLISSVNFVNHSFNNPVQAARAFANQKQYWKDFVEIMNSDMLKQRRAGLQINVTEAELAAAASGQKNKGKAALAWILKQGYIPTKVCDSFAIASGGATYYRNAIRKYVKEGFSEAEAKKKAWVDFQAIAERTQQSSRPDLLSAQQVSVGGRIILPFANTPMQMNRIMMKELLDIKNGRYKGFAGDGSITNKMSKIGYYGFVQSAIFAGLQSGLFALMLNSDDDTLKAEKKVYAANTMADSFLRGMGIPGAVLAGVKNSILEFQKQNDKGWGADYDEVTEDLLNISPTVGSKVGKLDAAGNTYHYNKKEILKDGLTLDGPALEGLTMGIEALGNIPVNRVYRKIGNIKAALDDQNEAWQRVLIGLGWSKWDVGVGQREKAEEKVEEDAQKKIDKEKRKKEKQEAIKNFKDGDDLDNDGIKEYKCRSMTKSGRRCKNRTENKNKKCYAHQ